MKGLDVSNLKLLTLCCRASQMTFSQRMELESFDWRCEVQMRMTLCLLARRLVREGMHCHVR